MIAYPGLPQIQTCGFPALARLLKIAANTLSLIFAESVPEPQTDRTARRQTEILVFCCRGWSLAWFNGTMARRLRIRYADAIYHVIARGNAGQDIVVDDTDRQRLVGGLEKAVRRSGWVLYSLS